MRPLPRQRRHPFLSSQLKGSHKMRICLILALCAAGTLATGEAAQAKPSACEQKMPKWWLCHPSEGTRGDATHPGRRNTPAKTSPAKSDGDTGSTPEGSKGQGGKANSPTQERPDGSYGETGRPGPADNQATGPDSGNASATTASIGRSDARQSDRGRKGKGDRARRGRKK